MNDKKRELKKKTLELRDYYKRISRYVSKIDSQMECLSKRRQDYINNLEEIDRQMEELKEAENKLNGDKNGRRPNKEPTGAE